MTDPLETAAREARLAREHTTARNAAIVAARRAGHSISAIHRKTELARPSINHILRRDTMDAKLTYLAVHTKGYDSGDDLLILAAPADRVADMETLANRLCGPNGKIAPASPGRVWTLAGDAPHVLYGDDRQPDVPPQVRIARCAERTVEDFGATNAAIMARMDGDR